MKQQTGADQLVDALGHAGVKYVFGLPGTQTLALFEALRQSRLKTVLATNELSAAFMAGGVARVTGVPGVVVTIPGPGFMWALTGVAEALLDSVPLVHISGAPIDEPVGRRARQQELAQAAIAAPLVKGIVEADSYVKPGSAAIDALRLACAGEPGPVLLHISSATLKRPFDAPAARTPHSPRTKHGGLAAICARVRSARCPIFIMGQGANPYAAQVRKIVERLNAPLLTTPSARGLLPEDNPLNFPFDPFVASMPDVNDLFERCDLIVAAACKLGHGSTGGFELRLPPDQLIHVDASAEVVGANYPASLEVVADIRDLLDALLASDLRASSWTSDDIDKWRDRITRRHDDSLEPFVAGTDAGNARAFFESLRRALPRDSILVLDSGLHQLLARRYYRVLAPCGLMMPADLQSMGYAIPTAIGARLAAPKRTVVALLGDGGFAMTGLELLTAKREGISLVVIVFVDGSLGQIRMQQLGNYGATHAVDLQNPDLRLFAEAIGVGYELAAAEDIEAIVKRSIERSDVTLIEVPVGDTMKIRGHAAMVRTGEATRRIISPRFSRLLKSLVRRRK